MSAGLECIAEDPANVAVGAAPMSLWMRSDPDDKDKLDDRDISGDLVQAVRLCRRGQSLNPLNVKKGDRNPSHAIHFTLTDPDGEPEIDLSIYGTPTGVSDEEVALPPPKSKGRPPKFGRLTHAPISKLTLFGKFKEKLPVTSNREDGVYHAYVFTQITRVDATVFAVFADDGHEMQEFEMKSVDTVVQNDRIVEDMKEHGGKSVKVIRLGQVAREELSFQAVDDVEEGSTTSEMVL